MTATTLPVATTTTQGPPPPKEIEPAYLVNGAFPLYILNSPDDLALIRAKPHTHCYMLGYYSNDKNEITAQLFKMVNTPQIYTVSIASMNEIGLKAKIDQQFKWMLPPIPWAMIEKMDQFFRGVEEKQGTEAIVLLTYDEALMGSENPSEGWDFYVPKQTNTAGTCDYSNEEVDSFLEGTTKILAGSVHSHPNMPAYASGIDHEDQQHFEGLHITYGWKGPQTEYYAEVISGGTKWEIKDFSTIFDSPPVPKLEFADMESLFENVEKKTLVQPSTTVYNNRTYVGGYGATGGGQNKYTGPGGYTNSGPSIKGPTIKLPKDAPDPQTDIIVASLMEGTEKCPFCNVPISRHSFDNHKCYHCSSLIIRDGESWMNINADRKANNFLIVPELDAENPKATRTIHVWRVEEAENGKLVDIFDCVFTPAGVDAKK